MTPADARVASVAQAILDGAPVDWAAAESSADADARLMLQQLRLVACVADVHRLPSSASAGVPVGKAPALAVPCEWGHLNVLERIGSGAFGDVYRAWDTRLDREVALKLLAADCASGHSRTTAVIEEGRLLARVRHPNVVTIYGADRVHDRAGLWMELIKGRTLQHVLEGGSRFTAADAIRTGIELCQAVEAVHAAGLLHRDIKPHNVMVAEDGRVVLMDFGTGQAREGPPASAPAGTPLYMAPEILSGTAPTIQSDIYSLGVLLYYLVSGSYPVEARTVRRLRRAHDTHDRIGIAARRRDLPWALARVIERATDPRPSERYPSAQRLGEALTAIRTGPRQARWRYVLGAAALAAGVGIGLEVQSDPDQPERASPGLAASPTDVLLPEMGATGRMRLSRSETRSAEALRHYLFGRYHMEVRSRERMLEAEREFRNAIRLDPAYARAYAALSVVLTHSAFLEGRAGVDVMRQAREAATTAISLDDSVALAHTALGYVLECFEYDYLRSQVEHLRAVALDDSDVWVLRAYASFLMRRGASDESLTVIRRALALDPVSPLSQRHYAMLLYAARQYDECVSVSRTTLSLDQHDSTLSYQWLARCLEMQGRQDEAVDAYEDGRAARGDPREAEHLKRVYRSHGWDAYWRERLRLSDGESAGRTAALVRLGRRQEALDLLDEAFDARAPWIGFMNHPQWDPLLPEPRFQAMRRRLGLGDRMVAELAAARRRAPADTQP